MPDSIAGLRRALTGITVTAVTPFTEPSASEVDFSGLERNLRFLAESGVDVIVPCGGTGEFWALTAAEGRAVAEVTVRVVGTRAPVVVGVGGALGTAVEAAMHAQSVGAAGVLVHQPPLPYATAEGLADYYGAIASAVSIGVALYVRIDLLTDDFLLTVGRMRNVVGIKYGLNDLPRVAYLAALLRKDYGLPLVCGTAEGWAPFFWQLGAQGFTSGLANFAPEKSIALLGALRANHWDTALEVRAQLLPFEQFRAGRRDGNNVPAVKEAMREMGLAAGPVRPPSSDMPSSDRDLVARIVGDWGLRASNGRSESLGSSASQVVPAVGVGSGRKVEKKAQKGDERAASS